MLWSPIRKAILIGIALAICPHSTSAQEQIKPVFHQIVSLGAGDEVTFQGELLEPKAVITDLDGRIYVADAADFKVKVFDRDGSFVFEFGRDGQGPGEFRDFESLSMDLSGNLLVTDIRNSRITRFSPTGEVLETMRLGYASGALSKVTVPLESGDFLTLYSSRFRDESTPIFHLFGRDFSEKKTSFGRLGDLGKAKDQFWLQSIGSRPGSLSMASDSSLVYAPYLYEGRLFRYESEGEDWKLTKVLEGTTGRKEAFKRVEPERFNFERTPDDLIASIIYYGGNKVAAMIYNQSQRVFVLEDGRIVHFSVMLLDEGYRLFLEVFDSSGNLAGYGPVSQYGGRENAEYLTRCTVVWKDDMDRFYLIERVDNRRVHVVSLSY